MNRRSFLIALSAGLPCASAHFRDAEAQDLEFLRALDAAQKQRPSVIASLARIAPESEPGTPLVVHGRLLDTSGAPLSGAVVFAYHTDRDGLYDRPAGAAHSWRLRGWARTDNEGRFEFRTIRPAPYPSRQIPAHVHVNVYAPSGRYSAGELRFADDPLVPRQERESSDRMGEFAWVKQIATRDGVQHVDFAIRLDPARRF